MTEDVPGSKPIAYSQANFLLRLVVQELCLRLGIRNPADSGFSSTFMIQPAAVTHVQTGWLGPPFTARGRFPVQAVGRSVPGDWDTFITPIQDTALYRGLHQRFVQKYEWADTCLYPDSYPYHHPNLSRQYSRYSVPDFLRRAEAVDALYESLSTHGWITTPRLRHRFPPIRDALAVNVTRDGKLVRNSGGLHRLVISQLLGLERVPARIHVMHAQWEGANRSRLAKTFYCLVPVVAFSLEAAA